MQIVRNYSSCLFRHFLNMEGQQLNYESNGNAGKAKPSCLYCQQRENNNAQDREMETGLLDDLVEWNPGKRVSHPSFFW